jgi:hypothetical protein
MRSMSPRASAGLNAAMKVTDPKRHAAVDTLGLLLNVVLHSAAIQDRDAGPLVLSRRAPRFFPSILTVSHDRRGK